MNDLHRVWQDLPENTLVMDNRTTEEFARGHVPGSRNIPMDTENARVDELKQYDQIYLYCRSDRRKRITDVHALKLSHLRKRGFDFSASRSS
ncbi:MAG: rhodanese-like domain-containing protein [Gammaproteobacteria bacterium]|nr:rhodanese-like domain-containing protein [Gammaproteobacteria bacterium]